MVIVEIVRKATQIDREEEVAEPRLVQSWSCTSVRSRTERVKDPQQQEPYMQPKSGSVHRFVGLTGLAFLVITLGAAAIEGNVPSPDSSPSKVVSYFTAHRTKVEVATILLGVALVFALFAFGAIRAHLSGASRGEWLATVGLGSGVLLAVAGTAEFSLDYALAQYANHIDPVAAQALNVAANAGLIIAAVAVGTACAAFGVAIVTTRALPQWLAWIAFVIGVLALAGGKTEPISEPLFFLWIAVTGIIITRSNRATEPADRSAVPAGSV